MSKEAGYYKFVINKLERLVKKEYAFIALIGIQTLIITACAAWLSFSVIEMLGHFPPVVRTVFICLFALITAGVFLTLVAMPLLKYMKIFRKTDYHGTAGKVGKYFPSVKDDLLNAMQLVSKEDAGKYFSDSLIDAAFKNVFDRAKDLKFESVVSFEKSKQLAFYTIGILFVSILLLTLVPGVGAGSFRLANFNKEFIQPPKFRFFVSPGDYNLTKGDSLKITIRAEGRVPKDVFLAVRNSDETDFENRKVYPDSSGIYKYEIPSVRTSFKYYADAGDIQSETYSVNVIDRPVVKSISLEIFSPAYSSIPKAEQKDNGNVTALKGSMVDLSLSSTKLLKDARLEFGGNKKTELNVNNSAASGRFAVDKDDNYRIILNDRNGNSNLSPIVYNIKVLNDAYPTIQVQYPNQNTSLSNDNRLPLGVKISDDYGFTKLLLHYRLSQSRYEPVQNEFSSVSIPITKNTTEEEVQYIWNLSDLNLTSEDEVTYYLEVFDNDIISGPKSAKSSSFTVRVPTLNEMITKAGDTQNKSIDELSKTLDKAEQLKQKMQDLSEELRQNKKDISWQEKQKIEQTLNEYKDLQKKVSDVSKNLQKMQDDLQKNDLLSKETLEKYMELQKLFDEMSTDEMKKAMDQLQNVLQNMNRDMTQNAFENMQINEDQFRKSIERTMNLLKRIQVEQKLEDMLNRTEHIAKNQEDLKNQTSGKNSKAGEDELNKKQNDITKDLKDFSDEMKDLQKKFEELKDLPQDQLDKLNKEYEEQKNQQLSEQASQNIQQNMMQQAMQNQTSVENNMRKMKEGIQQLQKSVSMKSQMQTFTDMMRITDNLITLSKQQEGLKNKTNDMDESISSYNENAQTQSDIQGNLNNIFGQLSALSQKTFAVTPEMGKALGDAERQMDQSIGNLQKRNKNLAEVNQSQAMTSLNEAANLIKSSMEQMMQGGQGAGMPSLMQQLQKLSGQQMSLNNLTQMLQQAMNGNLSMEQRAQMQRLARQQDVIRKSLRQLNREAMNAGQSKKIPANLEDIAKNMEEVVKNLSADDINDKVLQQQEHILSRLLDAQHSVNERDYQKERESTAGTDVVRRSPAELNLSSGKDNAITDELNNSAREGYTKDYQDLIRKYFEALQKENGGGSK